MFILKVQSQGKILFQKEVKENQEMTIGRDSNADITLDSVFGLSRKHIKISQDEDNKWKILCLSSLGGLMLNGEIITEAHLEDGDSFSLLDYQFSWILKKETEEQSSSKPSSDAEIAKPKDDLKPSTPIEKEKDSSKEDPKINQNTDSKWAITSFTNNSSASEPSKTKETESATVLASLSAILSPYLVISLSEDDEEQSIHLKNGTKWTIGRDRNCEICLEDESISRQHFEIVREKKEFFITDLGSANTTHLDDAAIEPHTKTLLHSGSVISVNSVQIFFEMRNAELQKKMDSLPALREEESEQPSPVDPNRDLPQAYIPNVIPDETIIAAPPSYSKNTSKKKKLIVLSAIALIAVIVFFNLPDTKDPKTKGGSDSGDESLSNKFLSLDKDNQTKVKDLYDHAKNFYQQSKYQLCISRLDKLHEIIPFYEQSKKLHLKCTRGIEVARSQLEMEKKSKEQVESIKLVKENINKCTKLFKTFKTLSSLHDCLSISLEKDPSNIKISTLISQFEDNKQKSEDKDYQKQLLLQSVKEEKSRYYRAKRLKDKQRFFEAIKSYKRFLRRDHPRDQSLRKIIIKARVELNFMENHIESQFESSFTICENKIKNKRFKEAYPLCQQALQFSPKNPTVLRLIDEINSSLEDELKPIYENSVINESLGSVSEAQVSWKKIIQLDIPDGKYYKKAMQKLRKY